MDKYDIAEKYLMDNPGQLENAWRDPTRHIAGCLFTFVTPSGSFLLPSGLRNLNPAGLICGCLSQIKSGMDVAWTRKLTESIRKDNEIPDKDSDIDPNNLAWAKRWQRKIDKELGRT